MKKHLGLMSRINWTLYKKEKKISSIFSFNKRDLN